MSLFADKGRGWRLAVALVLLGVLGGVYASWAIAASVGFRNSMAAPAEHDGVVLVFPLWTVTRIVGPERYEISKVVRDVPVAGATAELAEGDTVSVIGNFRAADGAVHETVREHHTLRPYKEALGVLGFVAVAIAAPFCFRVRGRRLVERWPT